MGLRHLAEAKAGIETQFGYTGRVLRAENRAMVESCGIEMIKQKELDIDSFDCIAVVDTQPGFGHTHLPKGRTIDIVIDHHVALKAENGPDLPAPSFFDLRPYVGATSSMVTGYLMDAQVEVPACVATALFYGVQTDTANLSRNASPLDQEAYDFLLARLDRKALAHISTPDLTPEYYRTLREALNNVRIYNDVILCSLGKISSPEMVAEVADLLLRLEGGQSVFCGGLVEDSYYVSVRTELERDAHYLIEGALGGDGSFGGHGTVAGGSVKLADDSTKTLRRWERRLERNILKTMGVDGVTVSTFGSGSD